MGCGGLISSDKKSWPLSSNIFVHQKLFHAIENVLWKRTFCSFLPVFSLAKQTFLVKTNLRTFRCVLWFDIYLLKCTILKNSRFFSYLLLCTLHVICHMSVFFFQVIWYIYHNLTHGLIFEISNFLIWSILLIWQPCMLSAHLTAKYAVCSSDSHACSLSSLHILCFRRELVIRCTHIDFFLSL